MSAPDPTTRARELTDEAMNVEIDKLLGAPSRLDYLAAAQVEATLALADALMDRRDYDTYRRSTLAEVVARRTSHTSHPTSSTSHMAEQWHAVSDHAADGTPFGGPLCNCERVAARARGLGWAPVDRPRWDDDLRDGETVWDRIWQAAASDHAPESPSGTGQERPNDPAPVQNHADVISGPEQAHSEPTVAEVDKFLRQVELDRPKGYWADRGPQLDGVQSWLESLRDWIEGRDAWRARRVPDPTFDNPITVAGTPAEQRHRFTPGFWHREVCAAGIGGGELCQRREDHPVHIRDEAPAEQRHREEKP